MNPHIRPVKAGSLGFLTRLWARVGRRSLELRVQRANWLWQASRRLATPRLAPAGGQCQSRGTFNLAIF